MPLSILLGAALAVSPLSQETVNAGSDIEGVWRTEDRTRLLQIDPDSVVVYDVSAVSCLENERVSREDLPGIYSHTTLIDRDRVRFWDEGETVKAHRLKELPPRCAASAPDDAADVIADVMAAYFAENYASFSARGVSKEEFLRRLRDLGTTGHEGLWSGIRALFRELDDAHLFASNRKEGDASRSAVSAAASGLRAALSDRSGQGSYFSARERIQSAHDALIRDEVLAGEWREGANGKLTWGWLRPGLAYVRMPVLVGWTEERFATIGPYVPIIQGELEQLVKDIGGAAAVVLDIRGNRGGNDVLMQATAAYFLSAPASYRWRRPMPEGWSDWHEVRVEPSENALSVPIYLLVDRNTVSSGELLALLLGQNAGVKTIGETTRGALSSVRFMQLPGGGIVGMPYQQIALADGTSPEGAGINPDIAVASFPEGRLISGYRGAIDRAVKLHDEKFRTPTTP